MEKAVYSASLIGTSRGSIISPILSNVYMDKFDKFVDNLMGQFNKGKSRKKNPAYTTLQRAKINSASTLEKRKLRRKMQALPSIMLADPNFRRLFFVRYADN